MRNLITIFIFLPILLQTFAPFVYDAAYLLNKNYIASNFCVNKSKPQMHCDGKCYLKKQKQKEEGHDKQSADSRKEKFDVQPFFLPEETNTNFEFKLTELSFAHVISLCLTGYQSAVFHPPTA